MTTSRETSEFGLAGPDNDTYSVNNLFNLKNALVRPLYSEEDSDSSSMILDDLYTDDDFGSIIGDLREFEDYSDSDEQNESVLESSMSQGRFVGPYRQQQMI